MTMLVELSLKYVFKSKNLNKKMGTMCLTNQKREEYFSKEGTQRSHK